MQASCAKTYFKQKGKILLIPAYTQYPAKSKRAVTIGFEKIKLATASM